jgi:aryl-alcohol dehydrogenase-like predicted oxidoreductase
MEKVMLGKTGVMVNRICLGCGSFGGTVKEAAAIEQLDHFRALGGSFLDTAVVYSDWYEGERSASQNYIGRWMESRGCRKELTLSVKGCNPAILEHTNDAGNIIHSDPRVGRQYIIEDVEVSLQNLRTDYLDIFTLHKDDETVEVGEILEALQEQKNKGYIHAYGCSNWRTERQREAFAYAKAQGLDGFSVDQTRWCLNVYAPGSANNVPGVMDDDAYRFHRESGIAVMAYGAAGRGYFQRLAAGEDVREADHIEYDCPENEAILAVLKQAAKETGADVGTLVMAYLLMDHGFQTIPLFSVKTLAEMDMCVAALDCNIPPHYQQELRALRRLG